ncbi:acyl-CoA--sterol O-acyltransferase 1-like [Cynara cardunculus var. scolymus]|uniref:acyl-CoA--sterol O-acyltransferase 1-like n=1 Tax=Cynara cardunculus var. scolymus TaxID=59895 RepID=UPI000D6311C8|nr:acyl-CoA--sterol O-acyltransferase 1-like [Cynara cardunculus var. scolymus]
MGGEVCNLVVDWSIALTSLLYSHGVGMFIAQGTTRFLLLLPVICLFLFLPLNLTTIFFAGPTSFFLSWLGTFKLTLFAFGHGPLSPHPSLPLSHFIATACLPIKIIPKDQENSKKLTKKSHIDYAPEILLLFVVIKGYGYKDELRIHPLLTMSCVAYYFLFMLVLFFAVAAFLVRTLLGVKLEPQFDEPQFATSVQNFWGKRWNLMVSDTLRGSIYLPARAVFSHLVPERWVSVPATFVTFLVSGIMHEMVFYYLGQDEYKPTWEVTWFFVIHGVLVGIEIVMKKTMDLQKFEPRPIVGIGLTWILFVGTSFWLFFPPFLRLDPCGRICKESMAFLRFVKDGHLLNPNEFACPFT